ncbi:hypothetical protein SASPL_148760 [Salvia splendens]|uniref:Uncharacterized protein n=1 Tax=Salvia splendens TaxID=180675 RepID=A0A8X8WBA2_SALSN|nr:hypothetical protein SASPL_148760 [Salvia splendens]
MLAIGIRPNALFVLCWGSKLEFLCSKRYEFDMGKAQREVFDKLGTVDGLTLAERYELCDILSEKSQQVRVISCEYFGSHWII